MKRLTLVRTELAAPVFCGPPRARELDERIATADLHALPAGPA